MSGCKHGLISYCDECGRDGYIAQLERELAEAQRDAARYRWIAAHVYSTGHTSGPNMDPITHWGFDAPDDVFWASVDAAMLKEKP